MVTDPNLLQKARAAAAAHTEAERQALLTRADYHTSVRRLHLAGATLREIAEALSISHQRVQQIVSAAGGTWWLVGRSRTEKKDAVCSWCRRPPSEVAKLIAGPSVYICDACVKDAATALRGGSGKGGELKSVSSGAKHRCSFCNERPSDQRAVVIGPANVCSTCLRSCQEILEQSG